MECSGARKEVHRLGMRGRRKSVVSREVREAGRAVGLFS